MTLNKDASRVDMTATGQLANGDTKRVSIFSTRKLSPAGARFLGNKCKEFAETRIANGERLTKDDILQLEHDLIANVAWQVVPLGIQVLQRGSCDNFGVALQSFGV